MKLERTTEVVHTETVISFAEYLLLLCQALEAAQQAEEIAKNSEK